MVAAPNDPVALPPDEDRTMYPVITHSVLTSLALLVVGFRLAARYTTRKLKWDDFFIVLAMITTICNWPFTIIGSYHGVGRHAVYLDVPDIITAVKTLVVGEFLLLLALCFVKVSVLIFLLNIGGMRRWLTWTLYANIILIVASTIAFCIMLWTQCRPVEANWNPTIEGAKCISIKSFMDAVYVLTAITILTDFLCALLPLPIIWKLHLNTKTRLGIMAVIALGLLAAASSIVRIALVKDFKHSRLDPTFALLNVGVWTLIELHIAIIVASLPPCRALALRLWASVRGKSFSETKYGTGDSRSRGGHSGLGGIELSKQVIISSERSQGGDEGWLRINEHDLGDRGSQRTDISSRPLR